jgi:amino acid permease
MTLLGHAAASQHRVSSRCPHAVQATANLGVTTIGAGIMALPRAFATLGIVLGMAMLAVVFVLSFFSLGALVRSGWLSRG